MTKLLSIGADSKTKKGEKLGFLTGIIYLSPGKESGVMNVCAFASKGCLAACLHNAGRFELFKDAKVNPIKDARIRRTKLFKENRELFFSQLEKEIAAVIRKAKRQDMTPVFRLNGTSDLPYENIKVRDGKTIFELHSDVQFYDYAADPRRAIKWANGELPSNYHITFSRKEDNHYAVMSVLKNGGNVSVVFSSKDFPETWNGYKVIDGDESDLRFLDDKNVVVGLKAKGSKGRKDTSGFIVQLGEAA